MECIVSPYKTDVFVCSDDRGVRIEELFHPTKMEIHGTNDVWKAIGDRKNIYGDWIQFPEFPQYYIVPPNDLAQMFRIWRCLEMLKEYESASGTYDVVIATRLDAKFLSVQPITQPEENMVYIPRVDACQNACDKNGLHGGVGYGSHLFWGTSATMKGILDSYHWSDQAYKALNRWCGEMMFKWYCDTHNIKVVHTEVRFMLIRSSYNKMLDARYKPITNSHYPEYLPKPPVPSKNPPKLPF
jgi:hypothetical protein